MVEKAPMLHKPARVGNNYDYQIGYVNNIPTMQFFATISRNTQVKIILSLTKCILDFQNKALGVGYYQNDD